MHRKIFLMIVGSLIATGVWSVNAQTPEQAQPSPAPGTVSTPEAVSVDPNARKFRVICHVRGKAAANKRPDGRVANPLSMTAPAVTVFDGQEVVLNDLTVRPYLVAAKREGAEEKPIVRQVECGTSFEITVVDAGDDRVVVDVLADFRNATRHAGQEGDVIRVPYERGRLIECIKLGEAARAEFDEWTLEVEVVEAKD